VLIIGFFNRVFYLRICGIIADFYRKQSPVRAQLLCIVALLFSVDVTASWYDDTQYLMGTRVHIELWSEDASQADNVMSIAMAEIQRIDWLMNPLNPQSELYKINQLAVKKPLKISAELHGIISKSLYFSELSHGAFDISFSSVGQHYNYRKGVVPSKAEIKKLKQHINYQAIKLDAVATTIFLAEEGMHLDLGGIAKGYAVDRAITLLLEQGITSAIVTAGGDSRIIGDRGDRPWVIGIKHPRKDDENAVMIPLENTAISTSGDYERFFIQEGIRYHHILSPGTGVAVGHVQSVSILAPYAVDSDALSTTVFVLGVEAGLALVNRLEGIDAIIIDAEGKLHYSAELLMPD
jgi:thiamine biosynthesis lipoprotein